MSNLKIFCSAPSHLPKAPAAANAKYWVPGSLEGVDLQGIWGVAPSGACRTWGLTPRQLERVWGFSFVLGLERVRGVAMGEIPKLTCWQFASGSGLGKFEWA